jgi:3-hydroxyisobutyrate dehydrogenase
MSDSHSSPGNQLPMGIGWIGVGKMGVPMSKRILNAGFSVKAFDVDFQRVREAGLPAASSLSELTRSAQFVFTMIPDAVTGKW